VLAAAAAHACLNLGIDQSQGRHLFAAAPHLAALLAIGTAAWARRLPRAIGRALPFLVVAALALGAAYSLLGVLAPAHAR
jgi:hypothetical protein